MKNMNTVDVTAEVSSLLIMAGSGLCLEYSKNSPLSSLISLKIGQQMREQGVNELRIRNEMDFDSTFLLTLSAVELGFVASQITLAMENSDLQVKEQALIVNNGWRNMFVAAKAECIKRIAAEEEAN